MSPPFGALVRGGVCAHDVFDVGVCNSLGGRVVAYDYFMALAPPSRVL